MPKQTIKGKKRLSDSELLIEMRKLWDAGERGKTNFYELLRTKNQVNKARALNLYDVMAAEASKIVLNAQDEVLDTSTKDAISEGILSDRELELILSKIAGGNVEIEEWIKGNVVLRSVVPSEQVAAIAQLYKKRGSYAAQKVINYNTDITPTKEEARKIAKELNEGC